MKMPHAREIEHKTQLAFIMNDFPIECIKMNQLRGFFCKGKEMMTEGWALKTLKCYIL